MPIKYGKNVSDADAILLDKFEEEKEYYDKMQYVMKIRNNSKHIWSFVE